MKRSKLSKYAPSKRTPSFAPLDIHAKSRLAMTIGQLVQNRSNGCLNPAWSRTVGEEAITIVEAAYWLTLKEGA